MIWLSSVECSACLISEHSMVWTCGGWDYRLGRVVVKSRDHLAFIENTRKMGFRTDNLALHCNLVLIQSLTVHVYEWFALAYQGIFLPTAFLAAPLSTRQMTPEDTESKNCMTSLIKNGWVMHSCWTEVMAIEYCTLLDFVKTKCQ